MTLTLPTEGASSPFTYQRKLGQVATGSATCEGCGRNKPLKEFAPHHKSRTGRSKKCDKCRSDQLAASGRARAKTFAAKREARKRQDVIRDRASQHDRLRHVSVRLQRAALTHIDTDLAIIARELDIIIDELSDNA